VSGGNFGFEILDFSRTGFTGCGKTRRSVILSEAKNLSFFDFPVLTIEERFFASLRMTTQTLFPQPLQPVWF
jgi:shikimate kinase